MSKKGNTGIRNSDLFCFNCGASYKINYPQPVSMVGAMMKQFEKDHANCSKKWVEPVNDPLLKSERDNAQWWATTGAHGTSSKTIYNRLIVGLSLSSLQNKTESHPCDPDDFSRCYKLLKAVPQWKEKLQIMKPVSPVWGKLVDNWDKLTEMYEQNVKEDWKNYKKIGMYEFMNSLGC